jgi:hypothetical protein
MKTQNVNTQFRLDELSSPNIYLEAIDSSTSPTYFTYDSIAMNKNSNLTLSSKKKLKSIDSTVEGSSINLTSGGINITHTVGVYTTTITVSGSELSIERGDACIKLNSSGIEIIKNGGTISINDDGSIISMQAIESDVFSISGAGLMYGNRKVAFQS